MVYAGYQGAVQQYLINSSMYGAQAVIMTLYRTVCMCVVMGYRCSVVPSSAVNMKVRSVVLRKAVYFELHLNVRLFSLPWNLISRSASILGKQ